MISVINPKRPAPTGYPSTEEPPKYPDEVLNEFDENENFVPLARNTKFIDYENAQIILIGAREGRDVIKSEIGMDIQYYFEKLHKPYQRTFFIYKIIMT